MGLFANCGAKGGQRPISMLLLDCPSSYLRDAACELLFGYWGCVLTPKPCLRTFRPHCCPYSLSLDAWNFPASAWVS